MTAAATVLVPPGFEVLVDGPLDGPRVLLLHGFPQDRRCWEVVVAGLVSAGCRCARFDQRGYAASVRPSDPADYSIDHLVGDAAAVLDGLGWPTAIVVGHDWGAVVAWAMAARHPDRVTGLVALSVPHPGAYGRALRTDGDQQARSAYLRLFREPEKAEDVLLSDGARRLREVYSGMPAAIADGYVERFSDRATLTAALAWYRAMDVRHFADIGPITVPTRFLWGATDRAVGRTAAEGCGDFVAADYALVELPGTGHWIPECAPAPVVTAALSLLKPPTQPPQPPPP